MRRKLAAVVALPLMIVLAAPAHAVPNYMVFLQDVAYDGIVIDSHQAVQEGQSVCKLMAPPNGASLWDAAQQVGAAHKDWKSDAALHFANRSIEDLCPNQEDRASF